ncbi:hypothetical protein [Marinitenerispora sediminis]|uniref:Uncharacterized protein n=1 Tax=Marinitenerispora sediminis TaxID=1931232 RepID=A0A368T8A3_9ACTN|nr:hypothetical protein [Marinitenerispora sediminis]RCV56032.1 hypothetical protein DEF28_04530 [Marinitenerispora sediminis]RCV60238.1 hypothetical protein DEF24_07600 [Marinitenerispora sediminis]RCV60980.1 hypothetical protein DEF23_03540 [Marinitenerispora sediminis]
MDEALTRAVDDLYAVFARYPARPTIAACPHCISPAAQAALRAAPPRRLAAAALRPFTTKALSTWGDADDFRHFLPRMLELGALDDAWFRWDLAVATGKLRRARWHTWPADEQRAVTAYCHALWHHVLTVSPDERPAEELLRALHNLFDDVTPFLAAWRQDASEPALRQLAAVIRSVARTPPAHLDGRILAWITHPRTREDVEAGFFRAGSPAVARELSDAHDDVVALCGAAGPAAPPRAPRD